MPTLIYTGGRNPFEDIESFVTRIKQARPGITDQGIGQVVKRAVGLVRPRQPRYIFALWGRDIMTLTPEAEWYWPYIGERQRQEITSRPLDGGEVLRIGDDEARMLALLKFAPPSTVNRSVMIAQMGSRLLSRTVVFSQRTNWEQEVSDDDADLLLSLPKVRQMLIRADLFAGYTPVRSYDTLEVLERHVAHTTGDIAALQRHFTRSHHHTGVDVRK